MSSSLGSCLRDARRHVRQQIGADGREQAELELARRAGRGWPVASSTISSLHREHAPRALDDLLAGRRSAPRAAGARSISCTPRYSSSFLSWAESVGWLTRLRSAARPKCRVSASATRYWQVLSLRSAIDCSLSSLSNQSIGRNGRCPGILARQAQRPPGRTLDQGVRHVRYWQEVSRSIRLTGVVSNDPAKAFQAFDDKTYAGKWRVVFFWPKDFTFVCPTEIAALRQARQEFTAATRSCSASRTDSEFVHLRLAQPPRTS